MGSGSTTSEPRVALEWEFKNITQAHLALAVGVEPHRCGTYFTASRIDERNLSASGFCHLVNQRQRAREVLPFKEQRSYERHRHSARLASNSVGEKKRTNKDRKPTSFSITMIFISVSDS